MMHLVIAAAPSWGSQLALSSCKYKITNLDRVDFFVSRVISADGTSQVEEFAMWRSGMTTRSAR